MKLKSFFIPVMLSSMLVAPMMATAANFDNEKSTRHRNCKLVAITHPAGLTVKNVNLIWGKQVIQTNNLYMFGEHEARLERIRVEITYAKGDKEALVRVDQGACFLVGSDKTDATIVKDKYDILDEKQTKITPSAYSGDVMGEVKLFAK